MLPTGQARLNRQKEEQAKAERLVDPGWSRLGL